MLRTWKPVLTLPCLACLAGVAGAEEPRSLAAGTLVRVTAPEVSSKRLSGTLVEASEQEIVLAVAGSERKVIPRRAVTRFEWSRHRRHPIAGAVVGAVLGGAFLAAASVALCEATECSPSTMEAFLMGAGLGALPGAGIGALIRTRDWSDVAPSRVQVALTPVRGPGVALRLAVRF